jgi:hypothetical protein
MRIFLLLLTIFLLGIFWGGFVAATLWGWFMIPLGVKAIGYWHAVGLAALLNVLLGSRGINKTHDENVQYIAIKGLFYATIIPLFCLGLGYLAKLNV